MKTSRPISTISFNTIPFLTKKLIELEEKRVITFWGYIIHQPEKDEKKQHAHVFMLPNGKINTDQLQDQFAEIDPNNSIPLKCLTFCTSKFPEWYLYGLHDKNYLTSIGQYRELHYREEDFVVSCDEEFNEYIHRIDYTKFNGSKITKLLEYIEMRMPFVQVILMGIIPVQQVQQYEMVYNLLWANRWKIEEGEEKEGEVDRGEKGKSHE